MKSFRQYFLILAISILPVIPLFVTTDMPHTHDGSVHLARMAAYYKALTDGQILPRWASDLNYSYGMPLFNFMYHTPYLVASLFLAMGVGLVTTFKLVITTSFLLSGIGIFLFAKTVFKNDRAGLFVTVLYQFAPFHLAETHIRGSLGEMYTYAALPFLLYGLTILNRKPAATSLLITSIAGAFLILSHNSVSLLFFALAGTFALVFSQSIRSRLFAAASLLAALALSMTYWLPALVEHKYTHGDLFMKDLFSDHFPPILSLLLPNFFNNPGLQTGGVPVQIGLFHLVALIGAVMVVWTRNSKLKLRVLALFVLIWSLIALFFMNPASSFIWQSLSFLRQFQFPWRFLSILVVTTSLASALLFEFRLFQRPLVPIVFLILAVGTTVWYWNPPLGFDRVADESKYWNFTLNTTYYGETDVIWSAGPAKSFPNFPVQVIEGKASITDYTKHSTVHTYTVVGMTSSRLVDNTQFFPGWRAYIDGQQTPIQFQDANWRGLITFDVPSGVHSVRVSFGRTPVRLVADIVSLITAIALAGIYLSNRFPRNHA